jgi:hypothetical protein
MNILNNFNEPKKPIFILTFCLIILILLGSIYYVNSLNHNLTNYATNNLKGYENLMQKINTIKSDPQIASQPLLNRMFQKMQLMENPKSSDKDRYNDLIMADKFMQTLYAYTNNHSLYVLNGDFKQFGNNNFPKQYKPTDFNINCMDLVCADSKQPKQLTIILNDIYQSDFPKEIKDSMSRNIQNTSYYSDKDLLLKASGYLTLAAVIRNNYSSFSKSGTNVIIANNLYDFVKNYYPEQFKKITQAPGAVASGLIKKEDVK